MPDERPSDPDYQCVDTPVGRLAFTEEGAGPGVVVAVPGLPGSVRDFRWLAPLIAEHHRVLRLDLPGYGQSPRTATRGMATHQRAQAVAALITELGLGQVTLLAHSSGSTPVAWLAAQRTDLVRGVVLLAPTGPRPHYSVPAFQAVAAAYRVPPARPLLDVAARRFFAAAGFPRSLSDTERRLAILDAAAIDFAAHRAVLSVVAAPALVCWAEDDPVIGSDRVLDLVSCLPDAVTVTFPTGGHNVQKTQAAPVADAVLEHLASRGGPTR